MEGRGGKGAVEISTANPTKPAGTVALRNFTIPRKKRVSGQVHLEPCPEDSRDYTLIQSKLRECRLDMRKEHANAWMWKDVKLVHNEGFFKEFSEKRSEMRAKGRHGREMEERFCFLGATYEATTQIYQLGLSTGSQDQYSLGKPSHGVYLFKHVDVALKHATASTFSGRNLIVFKVLFGKVKKVTPSPEWNRTADPTVGFDCHMAKDAVSQRDSLSQQVLASSVFLFDYNKNQELNKRPRQCLPYAVVSFAPAISATTPTSISPPVSPTKPPIGPMHGPLERLKGCTVAKRRGKGENATVTFKRFATQGCPGLEYQSQTPRADANGVDATPFQHNDLQTSLPFIPQPLYMPLYNTAEYFNPSLPHFDNGIPWQNYLDKTAFLSNIQNPSTTSICGGNTDTWDVIPQTSAEKISTIVYSSRLVKDPRLSRQETNIQKKSSEEEKASSVSESNEQRCQTQSQNQKENKEFTVSCEKQSLDMDEEHKKHCFLKPSLDDPHESSSIPQPKTENMPSIKLFKMKFQKYAPYIKMTEEERRKNIWSKTNLTPEQKQSLIERIHFYEMRHQRYKQGPLFQKDTETENAFGLFHAEPQNNKVCLSTLQHSPLMTQGNQCEVNQSHMRHSVSADVSNMTLTTVLLDTERNKVGILNTDNDKMRHNNTEPKESVQEKEPDPRSDSQLEPQAGSVVQSVEELRFSERSLEHGPLQLNPSETSKALKTTLYFEQSLCPSKQDKVNHQAVLENEIPTSANESFASKSTLNNNTEDCPEFEQHNIAAMDVANCVDISVHDVPESNDCSYATEYQDRGSFTHSKSDKSFEMSIEVERGEAQQHNSIYNALYERLQLEQLLSNSSEANLFSNKSYLRPKGLNETLVIKLPDNHLNEPMSKEEDLQLIVKIKSNQTPPTTERPPLSERFSKLRGLGKKLAAFVHVKRLTNSYTAHLNGDFKCDPEALILSNDGGKGTGNNNAELIQLMAQRYNKDRLLANCKRLRRKRSKLLRRRRSNSSVLCQITSGQLLFHVLRKATHRRKSHLLKAKKKWKTKLAIKRSSCGQALLSKLTSDSSNGPLCTEAADNVDKDPDSYLNSGAISQSQSGSQSHGKLLNKGSGQEDDVTNISIEDPSCLNSENKTSHDNGLGRISQTKKQCINPAKQSTEIVCCDVLRISNHGNIKKSQEDVTFDFKDPVIIEEMETDGGTNNNKISHQEKSSPITSSGCNDSNYDGESAEAEHKEGAPLQKKLSEEDNCDTKEISTDYNTGAYEDMDNPVPAVSSIPSDITSGNMISNCTAKAQTTMAPDLPGVMNNETGTDTEAGILGDSAVDNSGSGVTKAVVDILVSVSSTEKSGETKANVNLQGKELYNKAKSTDTNEKDADQNKIKTLKGVKDDGAKILIENTNHLSELSKTTADFYSRIIKDAREDLAVIKDNLHSAWQGQDKNSIPDTQIISKLRDYLTKFEFTVKKQETVNDSVKEAHMPMAWITLDSTVHKQQLFDTRHYNRLGLADIPHRESETVHSQVAPAKHKQSDGDSQPNSCTSNRRRKSNMERVSPDSTFLETIRNESNSLVNKGTQPLQIPSGVPNTKHWLQNDVNKLQLNRIPCPQGSSEPSGQQGNLNRSSGQQCQVNKLVAEKANKVNKQTLYNKKENNTYVQKLYSVTDISSTLKLADHSVSFVELAPLQFKCKRMLQQFISNFEQDQNVSFNQSCMSRNLILEKYLDHPPAPMELKFEAINSFLELQMMMEAWQFVENKINFLRKKPTFRSLLWYDPSLYGELYKGIVGFQQQSSLFSSFQQCLYSEDYSKLQEYYGAVSTLHQQLQGAPDTSYYMYLKTKRERLEVEAALRNPSDVKSYFLSVPTAVMINLGDSLESLEKTQHIVMTFIETPADRLPGTFDVGKAEHLSIICRHLQEKVLFLKSQKEISKISWFGMEHLLYDASKILVWSNGEHGTSNQLLTKYKRSNPQIVYGVTEAGVALVNKPEQPSQPMDTVKITPPQQMDALRIPPPGISTERAHSAQNIQTEDGKKTYEPPRKRATRPRQRSNLNFAGVIQPSLAAQPGNSPLYTDFPQRSNALQWRIPRNPAWDWNPPGVVQSTTSHPEIRALLLSKMRMPTPHAEPRTTSATDLQNSHPVRHLPPPLIIKPRPVERINPQPTIRAPHRPQVSKEQANEFTMPMIPPFPFPSFPQDTTSVIPPPLPPLPFSSTLNQASLHNNPTPISYPFFLFNGQTYSNAGSSVPVSALHTETQYLPHPL